MIFEKIDHNKVLPGPKSILISGYDRNTILAFSSLFGHLGIEEIDIHFITDNMKTMTLDKALRLNSKEDPLPEDKLPPIMIMSGILQNDVSRVIDNFNITGLKKPIFATTTEKNLRFTIKELVLHLLKEMQTMSAMKK